MCNVLRGRFQFKKTSLWSSNVPLKTFKTSDSNCELKIDMNSISLVFTTGNCSCETILIKLVLLILFKEINFNLCDIKIIIKVWPCKFRAKVDNKFCKPYFFWREKDSYNTGITTFQL